MSSFSNQHAEVVFLNSVYPILSETFIFDQYQVLTDKGFEFGIVSNNKPALSDVHPHMRASLDAVTYLSNASIFYILCAHLSFFITAPLLYITSLLRILKLEEKKSVSLAHFTGALLVRRIYPNVKWVHSHFTYGATAIAMWLKWLQKTPYSMTLHGADLTFDSVADLELKLSQADQIISISQYNLDFITQTFPNINLTSAEVIPLGVADSSPLVAAPENSVDSNAPSRIKIINVGRLSEHKAQHILIEACALLVNQGVDVQCEIIGEGPKRGSLECLIKERALDNNVTLLGAKYHKEVLASYHYADIFVMTSITEGMPLVLMEAMSIGLPVIAPNICGIPELLAFGQAGELTAANSAQSVSEAICTLIEQPEKANTQRIFAQSHIHAHFNLVKNTHKFADLLTKLSHQ
ncbi:glycosyltransferase family 4 protein [Pseudoalteromonas ulvae]|uniref:Glycosyl transferase family 1 domain-containing protein n=1 Tax=Pseudoalteromonas ulvae TaxID=107327 RepID=A0A244CUT3_PSEDV|nr:glycosyltransferase [Pseudoalteromonas ulvae]OUL59377.1 hypothetical protein B1199_03660 [Pseudoalteromonas ulvae]